VRAKVFHNPDAAYDVILVMDLMQFLGSDVRCSTKTVTWNDIMVIPFRPSNYFDSAATTLTFLANDDPLDESKPPRRDTSPLLYFMLNMKRWIHILLHNNKSISTMTNDKSRASFLPNTSYSGKLGCYPHRKIHLDVKDGARPYTCRPYPVLENHGKLSYEGIEPQTTTAARRNYLAIYTAPTPSFN
jgi:hypothetical protein